MGLFITGSTGFLGKNTLVRLLNNSSYQKIYLLIRSSSSKSADERMEALLEEILPPNQVATALSRLEAVEGDLTSARLGYTQEGFEKLGEKIDHILHIGASTDFGAPLETSRQYNVEGTRTILELAKIAARKQTFKGLEYISTAFVAGIKKGIVDEHDLDRGQDFANNYERSKWEAETLVHRHMALFPITVYRPSIVVGDSRNGYTSHFKVLYWPLKLLSKNLLPFVPLGRAAKLDVVPIDYVADVITKYMDLKKKPRRVLHITSGAGKEVQVASLLKDADQIAKIRKRPVLPMWIFDVIRTTLLRRFLSKEIWQTCEMAEPYYHYLKGTGVTFESKASDNVLSELGINKPTWEEYKVAILEFCTASRWGRRIKQPLFKYYT